jgi:hypothetical protein
MYCVVARGVTVTEPLVPTAWPWRVQLVVGWVFTLLQVIVEVAPMMIEECEAVIVIDGWDPVIGPHAAWQEEVVV